QWPKGLSSLGAHKVHNSVKFPFMASEREGTVSVAPNSAPAGREELKARHRTTLILGASAEGADARRRDAGDAAVHRLGAPTMQTAPRRRAPSGCGPQSCGAQVPAGCVARSLHTATDATGIARRSRLASGNCGTQPW